MKLEPGAQLAQARHLLRIKAGYQYFDIAFAHGAHDRSDVRSIFSLTQDNFGKSLAQSAVMVDLGEAKIFKRQMAQSGDRLRDTYVALAYLFKQFYQTFGIHGSRMANNRHRNVGFPARVRPGRWFLKDRKSTRLNSSHGYISYAVFCLK